MIAALYERHGPINLPKPTTTPFEALVRSIVFQQLAGAAARTIHGRMVDALGGIVTAEQILSTPDEPLRGAGLSGNKLASIRDLAMKVDDGTVDLAHVSTLPDDELVAQLSSVRGIGRWTAEMFLLFHLRRLDVWPTGDLGVRRGFGLGWGLPAMPAPKELESLGDPFRPYRSVVACYCWTIVDGAP